MRRLIVRFRDGHTNFPITRIERVGDVVYAYNGEAMVGMFDLGACDALYVSEGQRWISVEERLPEERVLTNIPNRDYLIAEYHMGVGWWNDELGYIGGITHWRPLPEPPKGE